MKLYENTEFYFFWRYAAKCKPALLIVLTVLNYLIGWGIRLDSTTADFPK